MERKLIRQGGGGYTVYLPKSWVERKGLIAGKNISIEETESALVITAPHANKKSVTLELNEENRPDLQNILTHLYRRGADSILLKPVDTKTAQYVARTAGDLLLGFEITQRHDNQMLIENISEPSEARYEVLLRRVFHVIAEMHVSLRAQLTTGKYDLSVVEESRKQLDKYILFCRRALAKELERRSISTAWELLTFLMHIGHAYYYLGQHAREHELRLSPSALEFFDEAAAWFELFTKAHVSKEIAAIHSINRQRSALYERLNARLMRAKGAETVFLCDCRELLRLIQVGTSPIMSMILETQFEKSG